MTSRSKRNLMLAGKWAGYFVLLLLAATLQTTPGFLVLGEIRPVFILPLCLGVAVCEGEYPGAFFGAVGAFCGISPPAAPAGCWRWSCSSSALAPPSWWNSTCGSTA